MIFLLIFWCKGTIIEQHNMLKQLKLHLKKLDDELRTNAITIQQLQKVLSATERERDRNVIESQANTVKIDFTHSELELKIKEIANTMGQLNESRTKFSHMQQQFFALSAERDTLQKSLETVSADRDCVRQKLRVSLQGENFVFKFILVIPLVHVPEPEHVCAVCCV